jgi:potassium channel subfamily K member 18
MARTRLRKFEEELQVAFEAAGQSGYTGHTVWNFVNGVLYCWTVITTIGSGIKSFFWLVFSALRPDFWWDRSQFSVFLLLSGYGHITPATTTGKIVTIIYAIIGIPLFLILLADFGRLFTRGIKFIWAYVRRLYYTGSCRKVRKTSQVQVCLFIFERPCYENCSNGPQASPFGPNFVIL